ncbi:NAD(P)-dependent oxidoreductase [Schaalia sp. JY-X159]|uniref:NAD(P)-dependent oxidoreductase n=1 Tax=Schaalia sp. JY-X159 TaxID=2758575 RepID=UPI00165DD715|nr:NAD(P)H-binding protein [Schaalia sp. JY-X159]
MARITVIGGTGYAGSNVVREAAARGHQVTSYSRKAPEQPVAGVDYKTGSVLDEAVLVQAVADTDVVVSALSPRGDMEGQTSGVLAKVADLARNSGVRLGVIGGAGSLLVAPDGPKLAETDGFPDAFKPEAAEMGAVLEDLRASSGGLEWFYVSPAGGFGAWAPGEATGTYRIGGDVLLTDADGQSNISGADLAKAIVTEIEEPTHTGSRFTVAY